MDSTNYSTDAEAPVASFAGWSGDESGVTAIEYGLLAALIVVACIGAFSATGASLSSLYTMWTGAVIAAL